MCQPHHCAPGGLLALRLQHPSSQAAHGLAWLARGGRGGSHTHEEDEDVPQGGWESWEEVVDGKVVITVQTASLS